MNKNYVELRNELLAGIRTLKKGIPDSMQAFGALGKDAYKDAALSPKSKELMALAIGIAVRCDGCLAFHAKAALDQGASREEVLETISVAIQMGGGPSMVYGTEAIQAYDQFAAQ